MNISCLLFQNGVAGFFLLKNCLNDHFCKQSFTFVTILDIINRQMCMKKNLFIFLGILAVGLGSIGVFIPGLPTTPFILLASYLFYRSSERLHAKLHSSFLGKYIKEYESGKGVPLKTKISAMVAMATMASISIIFLIPTTRMKIVAGSLALVGCLSLGIFVPTRKKE